MARYQLKGFAEPVRAWRVLGRGDFSSRFEAFSSAHELTPLVGRMDEIGLLVSRCEQAADGEGQVVLLSGEPGIGKSRMVHALRDRLSGKGYRFIYCYCSPYHQNTAFYPLTAAIRAHLPAVPGRSARRSAAKPSRPWCKPPARMSMRRSCSPSSWACGDGPELADDKPAARAGTDL